MHRHIPQSYLALVRRFPLRPIRTHADYGDAIEIIRELMLRGEDVLDRGQQDYLEGLSRFVADYESERLRIDLSGLRPLDALKHLMGVRGMSTADLGRVLASQSAASMLLTGRRELSKSQIVKLAAYFGVEPGLFLRSTVAAGAAARSRGC